jgi:hypothetical protein
MIVAVQLLHGIGNVDVAWARTSVFAAVSRWILDSDCIASLFNGTTLLRELLLLELNYEDQSHRHLVESVLKKTPRYRIVQGDSVLRLLWQRSLPYQDSPLSAWFDQLFDIVQGKLGVVLFEGEMERLRSPPPPQSGMAQ